jgi:hypothetical protein
MASILNGVLLIVICAGHHILTALRLVVNLSAVVPLQPDIVIKIQAPVKSKCACIILINYIASIRSHSS